jgi:hypothetical protein
LEWVQICSAGPIEARAIGKVFLGLGVTEEATTYLLDDGLSTMKNLTCLYDAKVVQFVTSCCKPGGGEEGHKVSLIAVLNLQLFVWIIKHHERISRKPDLDNFNLNWCLSYQPQIDLEKDWENDIDEIDYSKADLTDSPTLLESIRVLLGRIRRSSGILLSKVIQEELFPNAIDTEMFGLDNCLYASHDTCTDYPVRGWRHQNGT